MFIPLEPDKYYHIYNHANGSENLKDWEFSAYNSILSAQESNLVSKEMIIWFEDRDNFIYCHESLTTDVEVKLQNETL